MKINAFTSRHLKILLPAAGAILLLAGCGPEDALLWAPDGEHACVIGSDKTPSLIVDDSGNILEPILEKNGTTNSAVVLSWMPDSRRVIVARQVQPKSWDEYAAILGPERIRTVVPLESELARILTAYHGDWSQFQNSPEAKAWETSVDSADELMAAIYYLDQTRPDIKPLLEKAWKNQSAPQGDAGEKKEDIPIDQIFPRICELKIRTAIPPDSDDSADELVFRCPDEIAWAAPSPDGRTMAFVRNEPDTAHLYVVAAQKDAEPVGVDSGVQYAAWSPDGQDLAYAKCTIPSRFRKANLELGSIARRRVCTSSGDIIPKPESPADLAGVILPDTSTHIAWLADGRILFASGNFSLPATSGNMPTASTLFALTSGSNTTVKRLISEATQKLLPQRADLFVMSPDGKKVAIPGGSGAVAVLNLKTGALKNLQSDFKNIPDGYDAALPSWRNADELSYVVPAGDRSAGPDRAEVVIETLSTGKRRTISKSWPDEHFLPPKPAPHK